MTNEQQSDGKSLQLSTKQTISILLSFAKDKIVEQIQCVWFIILYLIVFQVLVLGLPIVYSLMIAVGIIIVIVGLAFFMEGLRLGLMPLGETLGSTLPRKKYWEYPTTSWLLGLCWEHLPHSQNWPSESCVRRVQEWTRLAPLLDYS